MIEEANSAAPAPKAPASKKEGGKLNGKNKRERKPREVDNSPADVDEQGNLVNVKRPDTDLKDAAVSDLTRRIEKLLAQRLELNSQRDAAKGSNKPFVDKRNSLRNKCTAERAQRKKYLDQATALKAKVDILIKTAEALRAKEKKAKDQLKFESVEQVDKKIAALEHRHETQALPKDAEKDLMKEISGLRATRRKVDAFIKEQTAMSTNTKSTEDVHALRAQIRACYDAANVHKAAADKISAELDKLNEANKAVAGKQDKLWEKSRAIQKEIDVLFEERDKVQESFSKEWNKYKKFMTALNKQRDAERKEREKQWKKEKEEYERKLEEEELAKKPWEAEIALCDMLTTYLENLIGIKKASTIEDGAMAAKLDADKPEARTGGSADAFSGMKAVGKKQVEENNFMVMGAIAKKKGKSKAAKKDKKIVHPIELLQSFSLIKLVAPSTREDVPAAIKMMAEKRAYYDVLPRAPRKAKGAAAEKSVSAVDGNDKTKKAKPEKVNIPSVESSDTFPTLPGSKSFAKPISPQASGPSASDRVKSSPNSP